MKHHGDGDAAERLSSLIREAHHRVEAAERTRINQAEMAARLGVSQRAYVDYLRGKGPTGARVAFDILAMLTDDEVIAILRRWRDGCGKNGKDENGFGI